LKELSNEPISAEDSNAELLPDSIEADEIRAELGHLLRGKLARDHKDEYTLETRTVVIRILQQQKKAFKTFEG
jgi:hypothetical protein